MKILFFATYPNLGTGYSRIGNIISNYLAEQGHTIFYVGISNFITNTDKCNRYIHPNIILIDALQEEKLKGNNELYGVNVICDNIVKINPDIVFIYNDIIVISRIFNNFIKNNIVKNFKLYLYLDLVYKYEKLELINHVDKFADMIFVFSDCWKKNLIEMGIIDNKIDILYHGIDNKIFFPIDKNIARQHFNFSQDDFIILNTNRNNYRKCIDKTIEAFINFLKIKNMNPKIKLFLNLLLNDSPEQFGYDILNLIKISCIKNNLDYNIVINNNIYKYNGSTVMSDEMLNYLYNACDIGINTCVGEGFGLCNLEHGFLGKPQIISNVGGLSDIFSNDYSILINPITEIYVSNSLEYHGGYLEICSTNDFTNAMIKYYDNPVLCKNHGNISKNTLTEKYNWGNILKSFTDKYFNNQNLNSQLNLDFYQNNKIIKRTFNINNLDANEIDDIKNINNKNIIVITSKIVVSNNNFTYVNKRSIYSEEERFNQTIETINSIKKYIPNYYIILFDNSNLSNNQINILNNIVDKFINITTDINLNHNTDVCDLKLISELSQHIYLYEHFLKHINFSKNLHYFKISGRYIINSNFNYENYDNEHIIFKKIENSNNIELYYTSFFKINITNINYFYENLILLLNNLSYSEFNKYIFEGLIPNIFKNNLMTIKCLGITQRIAVFNQIDEI